MLDFWHEKRKRDFVDNGKSKPVTRWPLGNGNRKRVTRATACFRRVVQKGSLGLFFCYRTYSKRDRNDTHICAHFLKSWLGYIYYIYKGFKKINTMFYMHASAVIYYIYIFSSLLLYTMYIYTIWYNKYLT